MLTGDDNTVALPRDRRSPQTAAASAVEWAWCVDPRPAAAAMLSAIAGATAPQQRPGEDLETGGPLLNLWLLACGLHQIAHDHRDAGAGLRRDLGRLTRLLARSVLDGAGSPDREAARLLHGLAGRWPTRLRSARLNPPDCFTQGGLHPIDCALLAERAARGRHPSAPVLVLGLGGSGSYTAPLCAAALERAGHADVFILSLGDAPPSGSAVRQMGRIVSAGGWALLIDGAASGPAAFEQALAGLRLSPGNACAALAPNEARAIGGHLSCGSVELEPGEDMMSEVLSPDEVERWLSDPSVLDQLDAERAMVASCELEAGGACYEVELRRGGGRRTVVLLGRQAGLGFLGYRRWLIATCLGDQTVEALGFHRGVLFLRGEPEPERPEPIEPDEVDEIAAYIAARARRLDLGAERPLAEGDWKLYTGVRRVARLFQPRRDERESTETLLRGIVPPRHAVVDGLMGPGAWSRSEAGLRKSSFDLPGLESGPVTDPAHDLAATAIEFVLDAEEEARLAGTYARLSRDQADVPARLTLQKLVVGLAGLEASPPAGGERAAWARQQAIRETLLTRAVNDYLADLFLGAPPEAAAGDGLVWALRLEGVLETSHPGFPCTTPEGAAALRSLRAHSQQVLLVTGLSLGELRDRCATFGARGGVAEHGSVVWDAHRQVATSLVDDSSRQALRRLREALGEADVVADPRCQHSLRVTSPGGDERLRKLIDRLQLRGLEVVSGEGWAAVRQAGRTEAGALERLRSLLPEADSARPLHVVGAGPWDVPLLRMASGRHATANLDPDLRAMRAELGLRVASRPAQAGLLQIVNRALHGRLQRCARCTPPVLVRADATLNFVLTPR